LLPKLNDLPCYAEEIIHSAVNTYFPILNKNNNKLQINTEDNLPPIQADYRRISQVVVNLIANAIRFTVAGLIRIFAKTKGTFVEISVSDTGTGISPERLNCIFERYNIIKSDGDSHQDDSPQNTGTGLGLFICKHIVEEHGGEITVESELGKGTTVCFTLPIKVA